MIMAKDATFDIVSEVNMQEVDNAINQALKEITQRYDFKGTKTSIEVDKSTINIVTEDEMRMKSVVDVLQSKFIRRNVPIVNLEYGKVESSGSMVKQRIEIKQGIESDLNKTIQKDIKASKLKVQAQYMENKIRVSGKKIDDLQMIIQLLKEKDYGIELQFQNFRS